MLGTILQALQVSSIIIGGIYFLIQYELNIHNEQRKETLTYAEKVSGGALAGSLLDIGQPFQDPSLKPEFDAILKQAYADGDICPVYKFYYERFSPAYYKTEEERLAFHSRLLNLVRFYESMSICVNTKTCDLETACQFFFDDAKDLVSNHCIDFDRYTRQFGYSPIQETEKFLRACNALTTFPRKFQSLTYCEGIGRKAKQVHNLTNLPDSEFLETMYQNCVARTSTSGSTVLSD